MNPKLIVVSLTASVLLSTGCAAKNRWFSRKDYSEVQDPFMEGSEVASTDADSGDTSGRAKLGGGSLAAQSSGPKPITRPGTPASMASSSAPAGSSRATAAYPDSNTAGGSTAAAGTAGTRSLSGPALSDFLNSGGKTVPADQPAGSPRVASNLSDPRSAAQRPSAGGLSPAARAATMPTLEEEEASFSGYMQKQTASVNSTAQKATNKVRATEETASDFASWASQQKAQWTQNGADAVETVKAAPTAAKSKVRAVSHEARTAVDEAAVDFITSPEFDSAESSEAEFGGSEFTEETETESAEPLFTKPAARTSPRTERSKSKAQPIPTDDAEADFEFESPTTRTSAEVTEEPNPFDNPFGFEEQTVEKPVAKPSTSKSKSSSAKSSRPTIDESFDMDSGWKPADMKRP